jgi:hypothetical protein
MADEPGMLACPAPGHDRIAARDVVRDGLGGWFHDAALQPL